MESQLEKIKRLRTDHLKAKHGFDWYDYQEEVSDAILDAVYANMTLDNVEGLETVELAVEFSRQSGKTTTIVGTVEFIMIFFPRIFKRGIEIGIFAPQADQAKTDFKRLKDALSKSRSDLLVFDPEDTRLAKEESNAKTLALGNGSVCYIFPITPTSSPESKTLDLMIFEEAQGLTGEREEIMTTRVWPMGAATNAPRVYIGTAGTQLCYFLDKINSGQARVMTWRTVCESRRRTFERTGDSRHLIYEQFVKNELERLGEQSDEFRMPYGLEWITEIGMFVTRPQLEQCRTSNPYDKGNKDYDHYFGIDSAKEADQTVLKVGRLMGGKFTLVASYPLGRGINYEDQFNMLKQTLSNYRVIAGAIDATGQGDFLPDLFIRNTGYKIYPVKFSLMTKDEMYKKLYNYIINERFQYYAGPDTPEFEKEMLELVKEYKGTDSQYMSIHHADKRDAHDDHPDATALMVYAYDSYNVITGLHQYYKSTLETFTKETDGTI